MKEIAMLRFQGLTPFLLSILIFSFFISLPSLHAQPTEESQQVGSQVTIPINQLQDLNSVKLLQFYPNRPYAKCLVPGELFAAGGLLDMARIQAGETFTVNFPNASINFDSEGVRQVANGYATISISGLIAEGTELLAVCNIGYRGVRTENNNYTISVKKEGAAQAPVVMSQAYGEMAPMREEPTVALANNAIYSPGTVQYDPTPGEDCPECDPPVGEGSTGTETPPIGEGSLDDSPRPFGEGEIGEGPLPRGRGDYEPVDPGEIDRGSVDTGTTPEGSANPNDKVFVAQGTEAAVTTDPDFNSQNLVAMSGSGCSLTDASQPLEAAWIALFILAGIFPALSRRNRVKTTVG